MIKNRQELSEHLKTLDKDTLVRFREHLSNADHLRIEIFDLTRRLKILENNWYRFAIDADHGFIFGLKQAIKGLEGLSGGLLEYVNDNEDAIGCPVHGTDCGGQRPFSCAEQ